MKFISIFETQEFKSSTKPSHDTVRLNSCLDKSMVRYGNRQCDNNIVSVIQNGNKLQWTFICYDTCFKKVFSLTKINQHTAFTSFEITIIVRKEFRGKLTEDHLIAMPSEIIIKKDNCGILLLKYISYFEKRFLIFRTQSHSQWTTSKQNV